MERREQYDPEDIENLLQERSFDELLEEERAYVLRHLSGREEYEHMRALLHHVREEDQRHRPIEADDRVREHVLQAFRAQQRPQWRVWLNSLGGIFMPGEGHAMWRPALAIGMVLILFAAGLYLIVGPVGTSNDELAEVRRQKAEEPLPAERPEVKDTIGSTSALTTTGGAVNETEEEAAAENISPAPAPIPNGPETVSPQATPADLSAGAAMTEDAVIEDDDRMDLAAEERSEAVEEPASMHEVTQEELMSNQSLANASGAVQARTAAEGEAKKARTRAAYAEATSSGFSRPVSQDPQLLDLLSAGW